jgi:hypothetical protein
MDPPRPATTASGPIRRRTPLKAIIMLLLLSCGLALAASVTSNYTCITGHESQATAKLQARHVMCTSTAGASIYRDCVIAIENARDLIEIGIARANDRLPGVNGIRSFVFCGRV